MSQYTFGIFATGMGKKDARKKAKGVVFMTTVVNDPTGHSKVTTEGPVRTAHFDGRHLTVGLMIRPVSKYQVNF